MFWCFLDLDAYFLCQIREVFLSVLFPLFSWDSIMPMVECLILSQRSLTRSSFLKCIYFWFSNSVISTILPIMSLTCSSASYLLLIFSSIFFFNYCFLIVFSLLKFSLSLSTHLPNLVSTLMTITLNFLSG